MDTRLDWHTGMELTPAAFIESDTLEYRYKLLLRKIIASKIYGLIPDLKKEIDWFVDNDNIVINSLKFNALTRSGEIMNVDFQQTELAITSQQSDTLYIVTELMPDTECYSQNGIGKVRQKCILTTKTLNELKERKAFNVIPFGKVRSKHERYIKDDQYIAPIITIESSPDLRELIDEINDNIAAIISHANFSSPGNELAIAMLRDSILDFNASNAPSDYFEVCRGFITLLSLYVFKDKVTSPTFEQNDIMIWFNWFRNLTCEALSVLNAMVVEELTPQKEEPVEDVFTPII